MKGAATRQLVKEHGDNPFTWVFLVCWVGFLAVWTLAIADAILADPTAVGVLLGLATYSVGLGGSAFLAGAWWRDLRDDFKEER